MLKTNASQPDADHAGGGRAARALAATGRTCARHPWRVLVAVVLSIVALGPLGVAAGAGFTDDFSVPGADSQAAADLLEDRFPSQAGESTQVVVAAEADGALADGPDAAAAIQAFDSLADVESVVAVTPPQVSADGRTAFVSVQHDAMAQDLPADTYDELRGAMDPADDAGLEVSYRGNLVTLQGEQPAPVGELLGILAGILILTLLFRSAVAMVVTLVAAVVSVIAGTTLLALVSAYVAVPTVAPTLVVMLGLGAGIDYALFMVARFRDRLRRGEDVVTAAGHAAGSTGVAVLMAGVIVVVSISALFVTGIPLIARMGFAAGLVVGLCALAAVTLVPSLLAIAGRRTLPRAERRGEEAADSGREGHRARALARAVTGRPALWTLVTSVVLLALAAPALNLELGNPDDGTRPAEDTRRVAYDRLSEGFGPGFNGPLLLAVDLPGDDDEDQQVLQELQRRASDLPGVVSTTPPQVNDAGDAAVLTLVPGSKPQDAGTSDLVDRLRTDVVPSAVAGTAADVHVGGVTATFDDLAQTVADRLWLLIAVVVGLSLVLLTVLFRSVWLPLVSAAFNLLSIGAAYGVVTLAFQTETGADLLGVTEQPIISFVPMLMFAILFGLSMDYNVFLLSRVREQWLTGVGAREAVLTGIGQTAGVIGAAGAIMTLVFAGFLLEEASEIKMIGLGLGVAVLIDVTLVRLVLSPAVLHLLGERAWWFPRSLEWLPRLDLEH